MRSALVLAALITSVIPIGASRVASAQGWPQWRGPTHNAISQETGLADRWPESGPPVLWTREIGQGYSAFAAVEDRVYTLTQTLYEQAVICLDAETGNQIWSHRYGWPYEGGGLYPGPRATPTWYRNRIYFAAPDGSIGCLNAQDGSRLWLTNPKEKFRGQGTDFGCSASPLVIDDLVIVPVGGRTASVVALDAATGNLVWASGQAPASYCTPMPITFRGQQLVVTFLENSLAGFDLKTGQLQWNLEFSQGYDEHAAAPLYDEPYLMVASPFRSGAQLWKLDSSAQVPAETDAAREDTRTTPMTATRVWDNPRFSNDVASSLLWQGHVYGFDLRDAQSRLNRPSRGEFRCLDFATGKIKWSSDRPGHANSILADGKLLLFNDRGELILAKASSDEYQELARTTVFREEICWTPPALSRGRVYLRTQNRAVCLYLGNTPLTQSVKTTSVAEIRPAFRLSTDLLLGGEREYPATTPEWSEMGYWYAWSLAAFGCATLVGVATGIAGGMLQLIWHRFRRLTPPTTSLNPGSVDHKWLRHWRLGFWSTLLASGLTGSVLLNHWRPHYVYSWPLALWALLQVTVMTIVWSERQANKRQARWWSRGAGLLLIAGSAGYFHVCRSLGLSIEWSYLIGYLPAFPVAAVCAAPLISQRTWSWLVDPVIAFASWSAYMWACALFMKWWLVVGS